MLNVKADNVEDILLEAGLINNEQLQDAHNIHQATGENIGKILLNDGMNNYKETLSALAKKMGVEFADLENIKVNKDAIQKITPQVAERYFVFPFDIQDNMLFLAMKNPDDIFIIDEIKVFAQTEIKPFLAESRLIAKALQYFYKIETENQTKADEVKAKNQNASNIQDNRNAKRTVEIKMSADSSTIDIENSIRSIILKAFKIDASDIHIDTFKKQLRVRYRVDGKLMEEREFSKLNPEAVIIRLKVMAGLFTCDRNIPQKGRISYEINRNEKVYIDTLTLPTVNGEKLLLKMENIYSILNINDLGLSDYEKNCIDIMFRRKSGMIIVSGLNGNGKTTTAYALVKKIASEDLNIITLEKKVLDRIEGVNQIQAGTRNEEGMLNLIKSVIEHDPDVLMVDVEADYNIIKQLMNAALGGKLIILTSSFPNVFEVLTGLINMGFEPYTVAAAVEGIVAQHLVRKLCSSCKSGISNGNVQDSKDGSAVKKEKCEICNNTGYKGKTGVFEVFNMNKEYRKLLSKANNLNIVEAKIENEKSTYEKNCIRLVNDEITSIEEIVRSGLGKGIFEN